MTDNEKSIKVWDLFVRKFHWILVLTVIGLYLIGESLGCESSGGLSGPATPGSATLYTDLV